MLTTTSCGHFYTLNLLHPGDEDYRATTRNINFNSVMAIGLQCEVISIFRDNTVEGPEMFSVHLSASSSTIAGFELDNAIVNIVDEGKPTKCIQRTFKFTVSSLSFRKTFLQSDFSSQFIL